MLAKVTGAQWNWLCTGREVFPAMLAAIESSRRSICLETYIYAADPLGEKFRNALSVARQRGVTVRVLYDALGSSKLPQSFWEPFRAVGGQVRQFNPIKLMRMGIRDHRKMLVCDDEVAFIGGFNIASEYDGDGVQSGWCDLGMKVKGRLAGVLARSFDEMFAQAEFRQKGHVRPSAFNAGNVISETHTQLLLSGPGRGRSPIKRALRWDLREARNVQIIVAYFLPTWRIRRAIGRVARTGGRVQLILAGKSDVTVSWLAGQSLYPRFLRTGVEIYEYQPQILHAKLLILDEVAYVGSSNLDARSLNINYELMVRFHDKQMAGEAREIFQNTLRHCRRVRLEDWKKTRTIWRRVKQHLAYLLLVRIDAYIAKRQWRDLPD